MQYPLYPTTLRQSFNTLDRGMLKNGSYGFRVRVSCTLSTLPWKHVWPSFEVTPVRSLCWEFMFVWGKLVSGEDVFRAGVWV